MTSALLACAGVFLCSHGARVRMSSHGVLAHMCACVRTHVHMHSHASYSSPDVMAPHKGVLVAAAVRRVACLVEAQVNGTETSDKAAPCRRACIRASLFMHDCRIVIPLVRTYRSQPRRMHGFRRRSCRCASSRRPQSRRTLSSR